MYHIKTEDPITDYAILLALKKKNKTPALQKSKQVTYLSTSMQYLETVLRIEKVAVNSSDDLLKTNYSMLCDGIIDKSVTE